MQHPINVIRTLIFGCALGCMTLDSYLVRFFSAVSSTVAYYGGGAYDGAYGGNPYSSITGYYILGLLTDLLTLLGNGFYILTMEKRRDALPTNVDYGVCGVGGLFWLISAILKFVAGFEFGSAILSLIVTMLYCACGAILYQWNEKLRLLGGGNIPLSRTNIGTNNVMNSPGMNNNTGVKMNNPGVGMNNLGAGMNHTGITMHHHTGAGMNNSGAGWNTYN